MSHTGKEAAGSAEKESAEDSESRKGEERKMQQQEGRRAAIRMERFGSRQAMRKAAGSGLAQSSLPWTRGRGRELVFYIGKAVSHGTPIPATKKKKK